MVSQLIPLLSAHGRTRTGLPTQQPRKLSDYMNETVVLVFFILGPVVGAIVFLLWFGGLSWGVISSFLH